TAAEVVEFPAASRAIAVIVWLALVSVVVSKLIWYGGEVSSAPTCTLSTKKRTPITPTLSEACADKLTVPDTVAFALGELIETVGAVVSGTGLLTVTVTPDEGVEFPAASRAMAVIV